MYSVKEIKMEIGDEIKLYIWNEEDEEPKEITEKEFYKLKPAKQIEILLDTIRFLHTNLQDDLRTIWRRIDKLEE